MSQESSRSDENLVSVASLPDTPQTRLLLDRLTAYVELKLKPEKKSGFLGPALVGTIIAAIATVTAGLGAQLISADAALKAKRAEFVLSKAYADYSDLVAAMHDFAGSTYEDPPNMDMWASSGRIVNIKYWSLEGLLSNPDKTLAAGFYNDLYCSASNRMTNRGMQQGHCESRTGDDARVAERALREFFAQRLISPEKAPPSR